MFLSRKNPIGFLFCCVDSRGSWVVLFLKNPIGFLSCCVDSGGSWVVLFRKNPIGFLLCGFDSGGLTALNRRQVFGIGVASESQEPSQVKTRETLSGLILGHSEKTFRTERDLISGLGRNWLFPGVPSNRVTVCPGHGFRFLRDFDQEKFIVMVLFLSWLPFPRDFFPRASLSLLSFGVAVKKLIVSDRALAFGRRINIGRDCGCSRHLAFPGTGFLDMP